MISFIKFLSENINDPWKEIDVHDRNLKHPLKHYVDSWVGLSHKQVENGHVGGLMMPEQLENNHNVVHTAAAPIRDVLHKHYGTTITAYRGTTASGKASTGRIGILNSYTTDKKVAEAFAGSPGNELKIHTPEEINKHENKLNRRGRVKVGNKLYVKSGDYVNIYDHNHNFITDTESMRKHIEQSNEYAKTHNDKIKKAQARVKSVKIPVHDVVWATDRANQKELIVRGRHD